MVLLPIALWAAQAVWGREGVRHFLRCPLLDSSGNGCVQLGAALSAAAVLAAVRAVFARSVSR